MSKLNSPNKEAIIAAARVAVSPYYCGVSVRKIMQEQATKGGIVFG